MKSVVPDVEKVMLCWTASDLDHLLVIHLHVVPAWLHLSVHVLHVQATTDEGSIVLQDTCSSVDESAALPGAIHHSRMTSDIQPVEVDPPSPKPAWSPTASPQPPSRTTSPDQLRQSRAEAALMQQYEQALEHYFQLMRNISAGSSMTMGPAWDACYRGFLQAYQLREGLKRIGKLSSSTTEDAQFSRSLAMWREYARQYLAPQTPACSPVKPAADGNLQGKPAEQCEFRTPNKMRGPASAHQQSDDETSWTTQCSPYDRQKAVKQAVKSCFCFSG